MNRLDIRERLLAFLLAFAIFGAACLALLVWAWIGVTFVVGGDWEFPWWAFRTAAFFGTSLGAAYAISDEAVK